MRDYLKLGLTLLIICAVAAGLLASLNSVTAPIIQEAALQASYGMYYEILGDQDSYEIAELPEDQLNSIKDAYPNISSVLEAQQGGETAAYIFSVLSNGYGGEMENAIVIDTEGTILGYRNLSNSETPGFGAVISEESYYPRYEGKSANSGELVLGSGGGDNEIEAISGSTITSNAVIQGLNEAVAAYNENFSGN